MTTALDCLGMSTDDAVARLRSLPCFAHPVTLTPTTDARVVEELGLGVGRTNLNYIVTDAKQPPKRYFARVAHDLPHHGVTRTAEQAAQRAAADANIAPRVVYADEALMVTHLVDGRALTEPELKRALDDVAAGAPSPQLAALTEAIRAVHRTPPPAELLSDAAPCWRGPHFDRWLGYVAGYSRTSLLADAAAAVPELESAAGDAGTPHFCHFDLLPDNFVVHRVGGGVSVVDFEYSAVGQPLMDVAILAMGCDLSATQDAILLASFLELGDTSRVSPTLARRFLALKALASLREALWGAVAEVSGASAISGAEAAAYTDKYHAKSKGYLARLRTL